MQIGACCLRVAYFLKQIRNFESWNYLFIKSILSVKQVKAGWEVVTTAGQNSPPAPIKFLKEGNTNEICFSWMPYLIRWHLTHCASAALYQDAYLSVCCLAHDTKLACPTTSKVCVLFLLLLCSRVKLTTFSLHSRLPKVTWFMLSF